MKIEFKLREILKSTATTLFPIQGLYNIHYKGKVIIIVHSDAYQLPNYNVLQNKYPDCTDDRYTTVHLNKTKMQFLGF